MAGLRQLDGGDEHPQERTVLLSASLPRPVVEVQQGSPTIVHVVEPVAVDLADMQVTLADLADVEPADAPVGVAVVWVKGVDGIFRLTPAEQAMNTHHHWGQEIRFGSGAPPATTAPPGAAWVDWDTGTIYQAEES